MPSERASKKQRELFEFIKEFIHEHHYGPSYREVMRSLDYKSVSTVAVHIDGLVAKGLLRKKDNSARSLEVVASQGVNNSDEEPVDEYIEKALKGRLTTLKSGFSKTIYNEAATLVLAYQLIGSSHRAAELQAQIDSCKNNNF